MSAIREAEAWALEALAAARRRRAEPERLRALRALAWARALRGRPIDDLCERFRAASDAAFYIADSPERVAGQRLSWRGEVEQARERPDAACSRWPTSAARRYSYALQRLHICELELRAGDWDGGGASARRVGRVRRPAAADLADVRALPRAARRRPRPPGGGRALGAPRRSPAPSRRLPLGPARGAAGARRSPRCSHASPRGRPRACGAVWEHTRREGVDEPGAFPVAPDLVEALVELGELDEARGGDRAPARARRGAGASLGARRRAKRCDALIRLASGRVRRGGGGGARPTRPTPTARSACASTARGRCSRLGRAQRRLKKWGAARSSLEQAAAELRRARLAGLGRAGARPSSPASADAGRSSPAS